MNQFIRIALVGIMGFGLTMAGCKRDVDFVEDDTSNSNYVDNTSDCEWSEATATKVVFNGTSITVDGSGASVEGNKLLISQAGQYLLSGTMSDGKIVVESNDEAAVKLIFNSLQLACKDDAVMLVQQSYRTIVILNAGTTNQLTDGSGHTSEDAKAAIFSNDDLVFCGTGSLSVKGNFADGISTDDGLVIKEGLYSVEAVDDGLRGKDFVTIKSGNFQITTGGDALKSDNEDSGFGYITIDSGSYTITSTGDGISSQSNLTINNGTFSVSCNGTNTDDNSSKGLKAGVLLTVNGGTFDITTYDDALHSDGDIDVSGGSFEIATQDDGFHAETNLLYSQASTVISSSYEGLEAKNLVISSGQIELHSTDDGLNASDGSTTGGGPGGGGSTGSCKLTVSGGYIAVYSAGDGVDVNGSVEMTGGTLLVHGPNANDNGAIDYDGTFKMTGGLIVASGSSGMAQMPSTSSTQPSAMITFSSNLAANTFVHVVSSGGAVIATYKPSNAFRTIVVSSSGLVLGSQYKVYYGGSCSGTEVNGLYTGGNYTAGTLYKTFTMTSVTTKVGSTGP